MKKLYLFLLLGVLCTFMIMCKKDSAAEAEVNPPAEAKNAPRASIQYVADKDVSTIIWGGSKPTGHHHGTIKLVQGKLFVKDSVVESGRFVMDMKSITVTDTMDLKQKQDLENHLKGLKAKSEDHFFNTNRYPYGVFELTGIKQEHNKTMIEGNLTLKEITRNIKFPATITITNNVVTIVSDTFKIDRTLWNINFSSKSVFDNLGNGYINDDIELKINVIATRKK